MTNTLKEDKQRYQPESSDLQRASDQIQNFQIEDFLSLKRPTQSTSRVTGIEHFTMI